MKDYKDREPEIVLKIWLVPHGYQVDTYINQQKIASTCRDYTGEEKNLVRHIQIILDEIGEALKRVRQRIG